MREIYFAGGCFWGVEHFFKGVDGVAGTVPGYANGRDVEVWQGTAPSYEEVYTDSTGFAETVRVSYREEMVPLKKLARLFFTIIDPLSLNRQGEDEGARYRSGVYYTDPADRPVLEEVFMEVALELGAEPVTELGPLENFYPAEEYHRDYLDKTPGGYCHVPLKAFQYLRLYQDLKYLLGDESDPVARMAETAAMIYERMRFFWVGFYRVQGDELVLGPFCGSVACLRIGFGKGVCGTAWQRRQTIVVPDVDQFPGHIACSSLSRSEIVVPMFGGRADGREGGEGMVEPTGERREKVRGVVEPTDSVLATAIPGCGNTVRRRDGGGGDNREGGGLVRAGEVSAVLDIDSDTPDTFDRTDAAFLRLIADLTANTQG